MLISIICVVTALGNVSAQSQDAGDAVFDRVKQYVSVVPISQQVEVEEFLIRFRKDESIQQDEWIIVEDEDILFCYSLKDSMVRYLNDMKSVCDLLTSSIKDNADIHIGDFNNLAQEDLVSGFNKFGYSNLVENNMVLGVEIVEVFKLNNNGQSIRPTLRHKLSKSGIVERKETTRNRRDRSESNSTSNMFLSALATSEGLAILRNGPAISQISNVSLSQRAMEKYVELLRELSLGAKSAQLGMLDSLYEHLENGLRPVYERPENGFQISPSRRNRLLVSGLDSRRYPDIDDDWIRDSKVTDQYYQMSFSIRLRDSSGTYGDTIQSISYSFRILP